MFQSYLIISMTPYVFLRNVQNRNSSRSTFLHCRDGTKQGGSHNKKLIMKYFLFYLFNQFTLNIIIASTLHILSLKCLYHHRLSRQLLISNYAFRMIEKQFVGIVVFMLFLVAARRLLHAYGMAWWSNTRCRTAGRSCTCCGR